MKKFEITKTAATTRQVIVAGKVIGTLWRNPKNGWRASPTCPHGSYCPGADCDDHAPIGNYATEEDGAKALVVHITSKPAAAANGKKAAAKNNAAMFAAHGMAAAPLTPDDLVSLDAALAKAFACSNHFSSLGLSPADAVTLAVRLGLDGQAILAAALRK